MKVVTRDREQLYFLILSFVNRNPNKILPKARLIGIFGITIANARDVIRSLIEFDFIKYDYVGENERYYPFKVLSITEKGRKFVELYKDLWDMLPEALKADRDIELELNCQDPSPAGMLL